MNKIVDLPPASPAGEPPTIGGLLREAARWGELRKTPYGITPAIVLALVILFISVDVPAYLILLPTIVQDLGLDPGTTQGIYVTAQIGALAATLFVGWYADRHKRTVMLGLGSILSGLGLMTMAGSSSGFLYGAARLEASIAEDGPSVPLFSLLADYYPIPVRGRVFAVVGTVAGVGSLLATLEVALTVLLFGWRAALLAIGAPIVLMGIVSLVVLREPVRGYFEKRHMGFDDETARRQDDPLSFGEAWRTTFSVRTVRRLFVADLIGRVPVVVLALEFPFFLAQAYGLDAIHRGLLVVPGAVFTLVGGFIGGGLIDAFGRRAPASVLRTVGVFGLIGAVGLVGYVFQPPIWLLVVLNCVLGFGGALAGPSLGAIYSQVIPPSIRTQGLQVLNLTQIPGLIFLIALDGVIVFNWGYPALFLVLVPFILVSVVIQITAADFYESDRRNSLVAATAAEEALRTRAVGQNKVLVCRDVNVSYDGTQVLFGVDFDVAEGEIIALLGTNGAGKSTLLRAISGSQEASDGAIIFDGRDITHMPPHEVARRGVTHMPGGRGVFPGLSVEENLRLGTWMSDAGRVAPLLEEAYRTFPVLHQRAHQAAGLLSGGEQQMLSLAQVFMAQPKLLMIDELSLGLSPAVVGELLEMVKRIHAGGTTIIVVEQSVNIALTLAQRAIFMEKGEVKFVGETADLLRRPDILRAVYVKGTGSLTAAGASSAEASRRRSQELSAARNLLEVRDVTKRFGGVTALEGVSLQLREGEILGLIGPNGSGKTTLFDIISGYQAADAGAIIFDGADITRLPAHERAQKKLIRRFQDARLFPSLTVGEALLVALDQRIEVRNPIMGAISLPPARRAERRARLQADRLIDLLDLGAYRDKFIRELSTGLRRIVDLAFVLAAEPRVLLMDEPSSGIAQAEAEGLGPLLTRVRYETGCSVLIIEHDMPLISAISDELIAMVTGSVVAQGSAEEVLNNPVVIDAFLGGSEAAVRRSGSLG